MQESTDIAQLNDDMQDENHHQDLTTAEQQILELNKHIIGQDDAKKALIRLTNCVDRRNKVEGELGKSIRPWHTLLQGPTGSGKTALVECHASNQKRPYVKTEATRYTEVGYVGQDVKHMVQELIDAAIRIRRAAVLESLKDKVSESVKKRLIEALVGDSPKEETIRVFSERLDSGALDEREIEIEIQDSPKGDLMFDLPGGNGFPSGGQASFINLSDIFNKATGKKNTKVATMSVKDAMEILTDEENSKRINMDKLVRQAIKLAENTGIIFIDEIDKIATRTEMRGEVNREGVQRDLLPLLDGTTVDTRYGSVRTHHMLFIAAGAFHNAKPSDLLPEFQGRFPILVKLNPLSYEDFISILRDTKFSLLKQYAAMLEVDSVTLDFTEDGIQAIAAMTAAFNEQENIGARRLRTVIDAVLEDVNFDSEKYKGTPVVINRDFVFSKTKALRNNLDLSRFII